MSEPEPAAVQPELPPEQDAPWTRANTAANTRNHTTGAKAPASAKMKERLARSGAKAPASAAAKEEREAKSQGSRGSSSGGSTSKVRPNVKEEKDVQGRQKAMKASSGRKLGTPEQPSQSSKNINKRPAESEESKARK